MGVKNSDLKERLIICNNFAVYMYTLHIKNEAHGCHTVSQT